MARIQRSLVVSLFALILVLVGFGSTRADEADLDKYIRARIDIGEMMKDYFQGSGGLAFGEGKRPSPEQMREMQADISARVSKILASYGLTLEEYRQRSPALFADEVAVRRYLDEHPDLKQRYEALPLDRMGRSGTGRGY